MKTNLFLLLILGAAVLLVIGCAKKESESTDTEELSALFGEYPDDFSSAVREDQEGFYRPDTSMPHDSIPFRRVITTHTATIDIQTFAADSTHPYRWAQVTKTIPFSGTITVWPDETTMVTKEFSDVGVRYGYFEKTNAAPRRRGWELKAVSLIDIRSTGLTAPMIDSIHVTTGTGFDRWFRDPAALISLDSVPEFEHTDAITVTAYGPAGQFAVMHKRGGRERIAETAPGTYSMTWTVPDASGKRHAAVDMVDQATVSDPTAPYISQAWGIGYKRR